MPVLRVHHVELDQPWRQQPRCTLHVWRIVLLAVCLVAVLDGADVAGLQRQFETPPDDARIMMRWWWFGPAVTKPQIEREMRLMKQGGIGGFEVQPTYPLTLDNSSTGVRNLPFLSDEFIEALRFTSEKAQELGLRMDLTLGSGWPFGGAQVPVNFAAGRLRCSRVRALADSRRIATPAMEAGEEMIAVFAAPLNGNAVAPQGLRELTDMREGALWLPGDLTLPAEVLFFISSRTGQQVKRPAVGAEGYVLSHYDCAATDYYLSNVGGRLMKAFNSRPPYAIFNDSLEVYSSDWTTDMLTEFQKRRGYDLRPYLPALVMDIGADTAGVRYDWGRTLTELYEERFAAPVREWARLNGTRFRIQGYGTPPAALSSYSQADLPEGEGYQWRSFSTSRWASSASHILGVPVTSSETWTWLHSPVFRATPLDMKAEADRHFLQGVNQLIGHGWPYTAEGVEYPGWRFYAAAVLNEKNPWWIVMPEVSLYLQRVSHILRQGTPVNDVAIYLPTSDAYAQFQNERTDLTGSISRLLGPDIVAQVLDAGFNFDFIDDTALQQRGRVTQGALVFGGLRYRALILPAIDLIPAASMSKINAFARVGGTVIATRRLPASAPGLKASGSDQAEVRDLTQRLFEGPEAPGVLARKDNELGKILAQRLSPDVVLSPAQPEIGFVHRKDGDTEIYFLANTGNVSRTVRATFRVEDRLQPEWWDPMTGKVSAAEVLERRSGSTVVALDLPAYGSRVLVFSPRPSTERSRLVQRGGPAPEPLDISADWRVTFAGNSKPLEMPSLRSWIEDEATRYFSGVAAYEKEITVPEGILKSAYTMWLDFGEGRPAVEPRAGARFAALLDAPVKEAAVLYVNGHRAGAVWCPPYAVDVTAFLKEGSNRLRIEVGNLAINHMAGRALPDYRLLNLRYGNRFDPQDMKDLQPLPSGLSGPIKLVAKPR
jgi:hypothetical protein